MQPQVLTPEDLKRQRREEMRTKLKSSHRDPYVQDAKLQSFVADVEKLKKHVEHLSKPHLNKISLLELEWKVGIACVWCGSLSVCCLVGVVLDCLVNGAGLV